MTQAQDELALNVGGSMLNGIKFPRGMACDAAVKHTEGGNHCRLRGLIGCSPGARRLGWGGAEEALG